MERMVTTLLSLLRVATTLSLWSALESPLRKKMWHTCIIAREVVESGNNAAERKFGTLRDD